METCTCSHSELLHCGGRGNCGVCNCIRFEDKKPSPKRRVIALEEKVAALERQVITLQANRAGAFVLGHTRPGTFLMLGYHAICERNSRALYDDYYLKSEVDAYLKSIGVMK